jgi:aspartyl/glutamyl-tRNA(Asn/Gln) amidotransferase C subunit
MLSDSVKPTNPQYTSPISLKLVESVAYLSQIPLQNEKQKEALLEAFQETLAVIDNLKEIDTALVEPTHQVTGLENILREDEVDSKRMFTQDQALKNASRTHGGYFVVPQIIDQS